MGAFPKLSTATVGSCVTSSASVLHLRWNPRDLNQDNSRPILFLYYCSLAGSPPLQKRFRRGPSCATLTLAPSTKTDSAMRGLAVVAFRFRCSGADPRPVPSRLQSAKSWYANYNNYAARGYCCVGYCNHLNARFIRFCGDRTYG